VTSPETAPVAPLPAEEGAGRARGIGALFSALLSTQVTVSLLGFVFWAWAARIVSAEEVGLAAAAISAMTLVSTFAMLGVGTLLIAEMPKRAREAVPMLLTTGLLSVGAVGLFVGVVSGFLAPLLGSGLDLTAQLPLGLAAFAVCTAVTATGAVLDDALLGLGRGPLQIFRNAFGSVLRLLGLAVLALAGFRTGEALLTTWTLSIVIALAVTLVALRLGRMGPWRAPLRARASEARAYLREARSHHTLNLILQSAAYLLPVLAAVVATPVDMAYFNSARLISAAVLTVPFMLTIALFASTAHDASLLRERVRRTVPLGLGLSGLCIAGTVVVGPFLMRVYGEAYGDEGTKYLILLVLAGPLLVVKDHYVAIQRIRGELGAASRWIAAGTVLEMATALGGGLLSGLTGLCVGWLIGLALEAVAMAPQVVRHMRAPRTG
jgi:O-antigen/teichoic acid export membrane protein